MELYEQMLEQTIESFNMIISYRESLEEDAERFIIARNRRKKELALYRRRRTIRRKKQEAVK